MKTKGVRLYGKRDLRLEEFDLPPIRDDEILAEITSDSICMSSYKAASLGSDHKRVPSDIATHPVIFGHEFCGEILEVGKKWSTQYHPGMRFSIQPALNYKGSLDAPGYSYRYIGGSATHVIIPNEVMEMDCLLEYQGDAFFMGSLSEPVSCVVGAFRASYHAAQGSYDHEMGIKPKGNTVILAGGGPMGLGCVDFALHADRRPGLLVVTDIDEARLARARKLYPSEEAARNGVVLHYVNTRDMADPVAPLKALSKGQGFDDVFVMAPVRSVVEAADRLLTKDGCMNFFAGPNDTAFSAEINFYDMHYAFHHIVGTSGGNTEDMRIALALMKEGRVSPQAMITHIGGLDAVVDTTLRLPEIPGGKKLIYTHKSLALTAIADFRKKGAEHQFFADLADICDHHQGLWSKEAEDYFLGHADDI